MLKKILVISAALAAVPVFSTPVLALYGVEAAEKCLRTPGCSIRWNDDGSFDIFTAGGGLVVCSTLGLPCTAFRSTGAASSDPIGGQISGKRTAKDYVVPESLTSGGGSGGDTGVPGTGSGGSGHTFGTSGPGRGPTTTHDIQ